MLKVTNNWKKCAELCFLLSTVRQQSTEPRLQISRLQLIQETAGCDPMAALKSKRVQQSWWFFQTASCKCKSSPSQYSGRSANLPENPHDQAGNLWCRNIKRQYTGGRCRDQVQEFKNIAWASNDCVRKAKAHLE